MGICINKMEGKIPHSPGQLKNVIEKV